jgi:hypothetical protein
MTQNRSIYMSESSMHSSSRKKDDLTGPSGGHQEKSADSTARAPVSPPSDSPLPMRSLRELVAQFHMIQQQDEKKAEDFQRKQVVFRTLKNRMELVRIKRLLDHFEKFNEQTEKIFGKPPLFQEKAGSMDPAKRAEFIRHWIIVRDYASPNFQKKCDEYLKNVLQSKADDDKPLISYDNRIALAKLWIEHHGYQGMPDFHLTQDDVKVQTPPLDLIQFGMEEVRKKLPFIDDASINQLVEAGEREELLYRIYQRFSGNLVVQLLLSRDQENCPHIMELRSQYRNPDLPLSKLADLFKNAMREQETYFAQKGWHVPPSIPGCGRYRPSVDQHDEAQKQRIAEALQKLNKLGPALHAERGPHATKLTPNTTWASLPGAKEADAVIPIQHGGGYFHILEFMTGRRPGYLSDLGEQQGIYVTPDIDPSFSKERTDFYAQKAVNQCLYGYFFDIPGQLTGTMRTHHMTKVANSYEAGIQPDRLVFLSDAKVTRLEKEKAAERHEKKADSKRVASSSAHSFHNEVNDANLAKILRLLDTRISDLEKEEKSEATSVFSRPIKTDKITSLKRLRFLIVAPDENGPSLKSMIENALQDRTLNRREYALDSCCFFPSIRLWNSRTTNMLNEILDIITKNGIKPTL